MNKPNIQLTLRRFLHTRYGMEGKLSMHAHHVCHTVEHPIHHLPPGDYKVILLTHPHLRRKVPCLLPLKADTNQVHSPIGLPFMGIGNGPFRLTDGSIIVGQRLLAGVLIHSHDIFGKLIDRLDKERYRSRPILLTILPPEP